ncbi:TPA: hypothetical protein N0F65_004576 [Lagenidium giganteum]|uniref:SWIM-type domain-containing protein n=1 Tax=Lagenidium giganteum TaxID=4803 RepID=A0AAV2ZC53_9STRA|nr:TPA: hypothetical protein N0F65_004576 [Lagenidium giganteum]
MIVDTQRVGLKLLYMAGAETIYNAGQRVGIGKSQFVKYVHEVAAVLAAIADEEVCPPTNEQHRHEVREGFKRICGFPMTVGALDGTLIEIVRFANFDGWYCRSKYPEFNAMALADHHGRFMIYHGAHSRLNILREELNVPSSSWLVNVETLCCACQYTFTCGFCVHLYAALKTLERWSGSGTS